MAPRGRGIVAQALVPMVIGTLLVVATGAWLTYDYAATRERERILNGIDALLREQVGRHEGLFEDTAEDLEHCRRLLLRRAVKQDPAGFERDEDGIHRHHGEHSSIFVAPTIIDPLAATARDLLEEMAPLWLEADDDTGMAIAAPGRWLVGCGSAYEQLVDDLLPTDPILLPSEEELLGASGTELRWSAAYFEPAQERWQVVALLPVDFDGQRCAIIREVPVSRLLSDLVDGSTGSRAAVWDTAGRVLADSEHGVGAHHESDMIAVMGRVAMDGPGHELTKDPNGGWLGIARFKLPGWVIVHFHDPDMLLAAARASAQVVFGVGLLALLAQIAILSYVLRRRIRRPLHELELGVDRLRQGERDLHIDRDRKDEIGKLARAFNDMAQSLRESEQTTRETVAQLERSEALYRTLFDSAADAVLLLRDGVIVQANPSAAVCFGRPRDSLVGTAFIDHAPPTQPDERSSTALWQDIVDDADGSTVAWTIQGTDGQPRETELSIGRVQMGSNDLMVVVLRDVTDRKRLEEQLQQGHKLESLGQLAGGIAHDFNNMLAAIIGTAELLKNAVDDPQQVENANRILKTGERAAALTNRLLAFARPGRSLTTGIDMHALIVDTAALLQASIDRRIELELELDAERHVCVGDSAALQNAILNLGLNSCYAMPEGGHLRIGTRIAQVDRSANWSRELPAVDMLELSVEDDGSGIPDAVQQRIFEPFFTTKPIGEGTGLGLSAVYRTVHDHGGAIAVHSACGAGTTIRIALPLAETVAVAADSGAVSTVGGRGTILLVDDEELVRSTSQQMLEALGYAVIAVDRGPAALELCSDDGPQIDAALIDMEMPEMRGTEVLAALAKLRPGLPTVLCSGFSRDMDTSAERPIGAAAFLNKPFRLRDLAHVLDKILRPTERPD